jgi:hypothetical protein
MFSDKKNSTEDLSKEQNKIAQGTSFRRRYRMRKRRLRR